MFCVRGFGGGVGVSLFFGGCSGLSVVFSRASGVFCVSRSFCSCLLGWVAGCGGFRGSGSARPGVLLPSCWGAGLGCVCARPVPELSGSGCGRGRWSGSGCARRPASCCVVVGVGLCPVSSAACCGGGFRVLFFPSGASRVFLVLRCLVLCWVVVSAGLGGCGGCRVGFGVFLRLLLYWPGPVWVWVGFCLESLILAQDERWRRA